MENLNAEQIKSDLKHCKFGKDKPICEGCNYKPWIKPRCFGLLCSNALALITSQEQRIKELTEDNERLRDILLQFTDIVHKWGNKNGYDTTEISLVSITYEANKIKSQIEADTVRKMHFEINKTLSALCKGDVSEIHRMIDQIAKELEGE